MFTTRCSTPFSRNWLNRALRISGELNSVISPVRSRIVISPSWRAEIFKGGRGCIRPMLCQSLRPDAMAFGSRWALCAKGQEIKFVINVIAPRGIDSWARRSDAVLFRRAAGPAGGADLRKPLCNGWKCRKRRMRLRLVPICDRIKIVGAVICVTVFDGGLQRFRKRDRRIEMETVHGSAASGLLITFHRSSVEAVRERVCAKAPCAEEIVFGAGAVDRWPRLAVG